MSLRKFIYYPLSFVFQQKSSWKLILFAALFPTLFFIIFKPFGLINKSGDFMYNVVMAGYGIISGIISFLFFIGLPSFSKPFFDSFNVGKAMLYYTLFFIVLAAANYIYKESWCGFCHLSWSEFFLVFKRTFLIGAIPFTLMVVWEQNKSLKMHLKMAENINDQQVQTNDKKEWKLYSDNKKELVQFPYENLLFIESADNYVEVHFTQNDSLEKKLLRTTLSKVEKEVEVYYISRCHRSFIINLKKVKHATGNSRGLLLELQNQERKIPVSRTYVQPISEKLRLL